MHKEAPSRKGKISDNVYQSRTKTLRELTRGFDAKDGIKLNRKLTPSQKRKINQKFSQYEDALTGQFYVVKVPQIKNRKSVLKSLQQFAVTPLDEKARAVIVPSDAYSPEEKIELIPDSKKVRHKNGHFKKSGIYYNTDTGKIIGLSERKGATLSRRIIDDEEIDIKDRPFSNNFEAFDMFYAAAEKKINRMPPETYYLITTVKGSTHRGGNGETVLKLLREWSVKYSHRGDIGEWLKGLRAFSSRPRYVVARMKTKAAQDAAIAERIKLEQARKQSRKDQYGWKRDQENKLYFEARPISARQKKRARMKGRL